MNSLDCKKVRNICILAHVDHGKTTLADYLIAGCGGGVHPKQAGKLRFMDYLDEEQRRAITMKSSSIALNYKDYYINLIDSPGHMDFCSEVSTAARLSDGALILVDAVDGVLIQTHAVLRQAWVEKVTPCLVLNKIDRLIYELKLTPLEAYNRLLRIVNDVNNIVSGYKSEKYLSDVDSILSGPLGELGDDGNREFVENDEEDMFQPQKGNVAFVCALDGWGFCVGEFAEFYALKFGVSVNAFKKAFWGSWYFNSKMKKIVSKKAMGGASNLRPMFVQFVLEPLWQVYQGDRAQLEKVIKSFNLSVPQRELLNKDPKSVLQAVLSRWLPLSDTILSMVVRCMPNPIDAQSFRIPRLVPKGEVADQIASSEVFSRVEHARKCVETCDSSSGAPTVVFVSKIFVVSSKMLPHEAIIDNPSDDGCADECFLAFARIYSGVLTLGQKIFVLSALYDPLKVETTQKHIQTAEVKSLYLMMGQGLEPVSSVKAGNIVAIRGLADHISKSATLSSTKECWPFSSLMFQVSPMLKVAIETSNLSDMGALKKGLELLNRADPFVVVKESSRGDYILAAAGEVHLERCIKDLKERFAKVSLEISPPLVFYKETIKGEGLTFDNPKVLSCSSDYVEKITANGRCTIRVRVMKLPTALTKLLEESSDILSEILTGKLGQTYKKLESQIGAVVTEDEEPLEALRKRIMDALESDIVSENGEMDTNKNKKCKLMWDDLVKRIWALGPEQVGPNLLLTPCLNNEDTENSVIVSSSSHVSSKLGFVSDSSSNNLASDAVSLENGVLLGFQMATSAGPLCGEPMLGLAFIVEAHLCPTADQSSESESMLTGQVMSAVKEACRAAVLEKKPRLVEAMYFCELNTRAEYLRAMYGVLSRRRARVLQEEMQESSPLFKVHAYLPVSESFGFAEELRKWTSGFSTALLAFSHWEEINEDPFFVPKTEEEIEEFGDGSSIPRNTAKKLIDSVRRRKGQSKEQVVQHATKQSTLSR